LNKQWPGDGLEPVERCPLCRGSRRALIHADLVDLAFELAPGSWCMYRCGDCGCGFLDPRPNRATIGMAYQGYYTHLPTGDGDEGAIARLRRGIAVSYANRRLGTEFAGSIFAGHLLARLFPRLQQYLDVRYRRHLPDPTAGGNRRLLDVGCGNGEFLVCAAALGWEAEGIDVDPAAVRAATAAGCKARVAALGDLSLERSEFQHITLSHVIEHVHDPAEQLRKCYELLAPGGRLWLQTPNLASSGHAVFGPAWRGLEPPRHLVLFCRLALSRLLGEIGFVDVEFRSHPGVSLFIWEESRRIQQRMTCLEPASVAIRLARWLGSAVIADYWSIVRPESAEFLTCIAHRPRDARTPTA